MVDRLNSVVSDALAMSWRLGPCGTFANFVMISWAQGWGIGMGTGIILKNWWYWNGNGNRKTVDRGWESELGTLIRACIRIGIQNNVHTILVAYSQRLKLDLLLWLPVCSFEKRSPRFPAVIMT